MNPQPPTRVAVAFTSGLLGLYLGSSGPLPRVFWAFASGLLGLYLGSSGPLPRVFLELETDTEVMDGFQIYSPWSDYHDGHLYETINWKLGVFGNSIFLFICSSLNWGKRWTSFIRTLYFSSKLVLKGTNVFLMVIPDVFHKISADFADEDAI